MICTMYHCPVYGEDYFPNDVPILLSMASGDQPLQQLVVTVSPFKG